MPTDRTIKRFDSATVHLAGQSPRSKMVEAPEGETLEDAMDSAWELAMAGIAKMKLEHGLFGVWRDAFQSGWDAANSTPPSRPKTTERLEAILTELWAAKSLDLHMCDGSVKRDQFGLLRDLREDVRSVLSAPPAPQVVDNRHEFVPNKKYPWFCAHCGYAPHEPLKHIQPTLSTDADGKEG